MVDTDHGPLLAVSWPLHSWAAYIASTPALEDVIHWDTPLLFIVRGESYLTAGTESAVVSPCIRDISVGEDG